MKPPLRITLFGKFSVHLGQDSLLDRTPHRAQELLAYLALHRDRAHPREALAEVLWPEGEGSHGRKYLRQALWQLHSGLLAAGRPRAARLVHAEADWVEFALDDQDELDTVRFERAFRAARGTRSELLRPEVARGLAEAVQLYRGDLLESCFAEWCRYERDRFRRMYLTVLDTLVEYQEARQEYEAAIGYATIALRQDPARERTHRGLMRLLAKSGDRAAALRQYDRCTEALRDELGVEPEPETVVLQQLIRTGGIIGATRELGSTAGSPVGTSQPSRPFALVATEGAFGNGRRPVRPH